MKGKQIYRVNRPHAFIPLYLLRVGLYRFLKFFNNFSQKIRVKICVNRNLLIGDILLGHFAT